MPVHDWSRVDPGSFHYFHQAWTIEISYALNGGLLPTDYFALADQSVSGPIPDVITLRRRDAKSQMPHADESGTTHAGGVAIAEAPPSARFVSSLEAETYVKRANRIVIRHRLGKVVAVIELVSPGNKSSQHAMRSFVEKASAILQEGISLLVVDILPPTPRDPQGIHKAIWDTLCDEPFELPTDKRLTVAAYDANWPTTFYVEPVAVGDLLPSLPIFLSPDIYVPAPLESTYQTTWQKCPEALREDVEAAAG